MPNQKARDYTVCFLFTPDLKQVLLQTKAKTDFKGRLNGVGGKLEPGEEPQACAYREIKEETGLGPTSIRHLTWVGTLSLPENCDNHAVGCGPHDPSCVLYYYAGIFSPERLNPPKGAEALGLCNTYDVIHSDILSPVYAGHGDLQYFVQEGLHAMQKIQYGHHTTPETKGEQSYV